MTARRKPKPPARSKRKISAGKTAAAMLPLALATALSPIVNRSNRGTAPAAAPAARAAAALFKLGCKVPFDTIKSTGLEIDAQCTADGNGGDETAKVLENHAKNNFCVTGKPVPITYDDYTGLQKLADANGLKKNLKTSRDSLVDIFDSSGKAKIGEGTLVQFVSFLLKASYSNAGKGKGENVNCMLTEKDENDIHIELTMDRSDDDPCDAVTAEMSPHFRPEEWSKLVDVDKFDRPVRITGPLFFDDSHAPCHDGVRPNPKRVSVWEIHPIYQFEVCKAKTKDLKACDVKDNSVWVPLDQWFSSDQDEEPGQ